jgi:transposase
MTGGEGVRWPGRDASLLRCSFGVTPEFKCEAVALLESSGRPQMQAAAELGIQSSILRQWRIALMGDSPPPRAAGSQAAALASQVAFSSNQAAEIARLRRERDRTRMERDVLANCSGRLRGSSATRIGAANTRPRPTESSLSP